MKYLFWVIAPCLLIFGAFSILRDNSGPTGVLSDSDSQPDRRELRRSFFRKGEILVVYGATDKRLQTSYETLLIDLSASPREESRRNIAVRHMKAADLTEDALRGNVLFLVGTPEGNPVLKHMLATTPFQIKSGEIHFDQKKFSAHKPILSLGMYPNSENDTLPVSILTGNNEEAVLAFFKKKVGQDGRSFFRQNMDYELYLSGTRAVMGDFGTDWKTDSSTFFDFSTGNKVVHGSPHFDFVDHQQALSKESIVTLATMVEQTTKTIKDFFGPPAPIPKMTYHIYKSAEEKGLMTGNTAQAHFEISDNSVHTVINDKYENNFVEKENALLVHRLIGESKTAALERGLPVYFTDQWQRNGYGFWSGHLYSSGNALTLAELFDNEMMATESPLIVECLSASLVDFLLKTWGKEVFLKRYPKWIPSLPEINELEPKWQNYLKNQPSKTDRHARPSTKLPYLKGFNFAHEGYGIYNGYASRKATESIKKQHDMGSNAMALVPYTFLHDKNKPQPFRFSHDANDENDESLVHSAYEAKKLGMFTVLKPQVWVGGGSWPGEIEMANEADWAKFFDHYYRWIRHYAFLAEIHQMDALCLGVELGKATLSHGGAWHDMIRKTKGLFKGKLTYAANWGIEFENIAFWDKLDFIGLNCYYPLSKNDNPSDSELQSNFTGIKAKIKTVQDKFAKPIVFTEIGFRSIDMPWKSPHAEGDDSFNERHQQRCYEVIFKGIENEPWCRGILWWKFPSYLEYRGRANSAFTPNNKIAEQTVRHWFSK